MQLTNHSAEDTPSNTNCNHPENESEETKKTHTRHTTQSNTHVLFTWLLVVSLTKRKNYYSRFFFLYWSIKNQFISFRLQAVAGFYACTSHSMPCAYICSFFCSLVAWRIPICKLIRCHNNNNNVMIQVKKNQPAHIIVVVVVGRCEDLCNVVTAQTIIFLVICVILPGNRVRKTTKEKIHMHKTIRQWQLPDSFVPMSRRMQKSIYARPAHAYITTFSTRHSQHLWIFSHLTEWHTLSPKRTREKERVSEKATTTPKNRNERDPETYTLFGLKAKFLITYS